MTKQDILVFTKSKCREERTELYNHQLDTFLTVADCGSFTKAAEKRYVTSASVMKQMNALEETIGVKLFRRTNHGVTLTPAGESVYSSAKKIIALSDASIQEALEIAGRQETVIRVGTSLLNPCMPLFNRWAECSDSSNRFKLQIVPFDDDASQILPLLSSLGQEIDVIFGACGAKEWQRRCTFLPLGAYDVCVAVPRSHPLAEKESLSPADLSGEKLLIGTDGDIPDIDSLRFMLMQEHPDISLISVHRYYDAAVFEQAEETGIPLLTLECWSDVNPSLVTIPVDWEYTVPYGLMIARNPDRGVQDFTKILLK